MNGFKDTKERNIFERLRDWVLRGGMDDAWKIAQPNPFGTEGHFNTLLLQAYVALMAATFKTLGQSAPAAATPTTLYTVPAATSAIISGLTIANRNTSLAHYFVSVAVGGGATANKDYHAFNLTLPALSSVVLMQGVTLATTDKVVVNSPDGASMSYNLCGVELS